MAHPVPTKAFLQPRPKISQGVILAMNHRGWLQGQLGEVLSVKTQGNQEYGTFKGPISLKNLIQWLIG